MVESGESMVSGWVTEDQAEGQAVVLAAELISHHNDRAGECVKISWQRTTLRNCPGLIYHCLLKLNGMQPLRSPP